MGSRASTLTLCLVSALIGAAPGAKAAAQVAGPYRFAVGDTARYHEVSHGEQELQTPQGSVSMSNEHDATIALTPSGPGTLVGWYEALVVSFTGPQGTQAPSTEPLLGKTFRLTASPEGRLQLDSAPAFPEGVAQITDLTHEFDDFLITVPAERPKVGATWQDTVHSNRSGDPEQVVDQEAVRSYRVRGDTVYAGRSAMVIEVETTHTMSMSGPVPGQSMTATNRVTGSDSGLVIFDWDRGAMLYRSKKGALTGTLEFKGAQTLTMQQKMTYTSTIERER